MDDHDRYLFDLQGFVTIPESLSPQQVETLNREFDARVSADVDPNANTHRFNSLLDWGRAVPRPHRQRTRHARPGQASWGRSSGSTTSTAT